MKNKGRKFEEKVQKTINSGATVWDKGDLKSAEFVVEVKYTDKKSYSIKQEVLQKLWDAAFEANKLPRLIIGIPKDDNTVFHIICDVEVRNK